MIFLRHEFLFVEAKNWLLLCLLYPNFTVQRIIVQRRKDSKIKHMKHAKHAMGSNLSETGAEFIPGFISLIRMCCKSASYSVLF